MKHTLPMLLFAAIAGCTTLAPPGAMVITCKPAFLQNQLQIHRGVMPPPGEPDPIIMYALVLRDSEAEHHFPMTSHRLYSLLNTNHVYTFTFDPGGQSNQYFRLPHVIRVDDENKTLYRFEEEMKKF